MVLGQVSSFRFWGLACSLDDDRKEVLREIAEYLNDNYQQYARGVHYLLQLAGDCAVERKPPPHLSFIEKFKLWGTAWGCGSTWATATCDAHNDCQVFTGSSWLGVSWGPETQTLGSSALYQPHCAKTLRVDPHQTVPNETKLEWAGSRRELLTVSSAAVLGSHTGAITSWHHGASACEAGSPWTCCTLVGKHHSVFCLLCKLFSDAWSQPNLAAVCSKATKEDETDTVTKPTGSIADRLTARMEEALWLLWPGCDF